MDVLVVGAGVAGCQVAHELAVDHDVTVLEQERVGAGATGLSAGLVAPTLFYADRPDVARHANEFFRRFDGTAGFEFTERPRLDLVLDDAGRDAALARVDRLADEGFPVSYLPAVNVEARYPAFDLSGYEGAVLYEDTGWVDPYTYATALARDAVEHGATLETGVEVRAIAVEDGRVAGVETDAGTYASDAVVVAAGWRTRSLLPSGVDVRTRPYRTQCVVVEPDEPLDGDFPMVRLPDEHLYARPEHNGDLLVGGGAHLCDDPHAASGDADESFRLDVASVLPSLVSGFDDAGFVNGWAGVDAATPDARPVVDAPRDAPEGLVVATGFNGLGVMVSSVVGPTVRERLGGDDAPFPTDLFAADRFDDVDEGFALTSTSEV